ncbi:TIGR01777 family oxidoreductase [Streptomyces sp. LZ34]
MKIVLPGGTGQVGGILNRALTAAGHEVVVLTRQPTRDSHLKWDGRTLGPWAKTIDGSDVVINLAGRSVSCRYTEENLRAMMDSRVDSARVVGEALAAARRPPRVWLQMSTATIYAHRYDAPHDEATGVIGGSEPDVPHYWDFSVQIAKNWEREQQQARTPRTRKVALRSAMVMSPDRAGVFDYLLWLARLGLGGPVAGGSQYVSWIHDHDFVRAVQFLIEQDDITGPVNLASPAPLPQRAFMNALRKAWGAPVGLPATKWMAEIGAFVLRSDTELLLKSRRVVPGRLLKAEFAFNHAEWPQAAGELVRRVRQKRSHT